MTHTYIHLPTHVPSVYLLTFPLSIIPSIHPSVLCRVPGRSHPQSIPSNSSLISLTGWVSWPSSPSISMTSWLNNSSLSVLLSVVPCQVPQRIPNKYRQPRLQKLPLGLGRWHIDRENGTARDMKIIDGALNVCSEQL